MMNELRNLLIIVGERVIKGEIPAVTKTYDKVTDQFIFTIPGDPRKLALDPDGTINWFDAENGPVE